MVVTSNKIHPQAKPLARRGRPPASMAGDVNERILDAATVLFLTRGYEATSCEEVVSIAGAGKASLYARYANKEELFTAVVTQIISRDFTWVSDIVRGVSLADRLHAAGLEIIDRSLWSAVISTLRILIETAPRFPDLAKLAQRAGRQSAEGVFVCALLGSNSHGDPRLARAQVLAENLMELITPSPQMNALLGVPIESLKSSASHLVQQAIEFVDKDGSLDEFR